MDPYMLVLGLFFLVCSSVVLLRWNEVKYKKKGLPPGTMGWPLIGETFEFLRQGPNFMKDRKARYGSFYKTHFLGSPTIISMDPDLNRYILLNESKGLFPGYPPSMLNILGKCNIAAVRGATHRYMRGAMLALISPTQIREQLLPKIDELVRTQLKTWENQVIDIQAKTKELLLLSSLKQIAGIESRSMADKFQQEFTKLFIGVLSLPINLPGTKYWHGLQARKNIIRLLSQLLEERRASGESHKDMLDGLMRADDGRYQLSDEEIIDQVITLLYSGFETVSTTSMMAIKYLYEHPKALEELRNEHLEIRARKRPEDPLEWDDLKSMRFTRAVVMETARLATIVHGVMRRTFEDIELNGYVIPKGWRIYVYTREINYDPIVYPDPSAFNPWRWLDKSLESHNYFLLFGRGTRLCPGKELGVVEISTFLHHFVTRYRWEEVGGQKLLTFPRTKAPKGLRIRVSPY